MKDVQVLIVGAGIGGLTAALALQQVGCRVTVFEQAAALRELGAGVLVTPNAMHALHHLGVGRALVECSSSQNRNATRHYASGEITKVRPPSSVYLEKYGAEFLQVHRNDLHALLCREVLANDPEAIRVSHRFADLAQDAEGVTAHFAGGQHARGDVLIGADGCSSTVRNRVQAPEAVNYTGQVAFRALVPIEHVDPALIDPPMSIYLGTGKLFLHYDLRRGRVLNIIGIARQPAWQEEGWAIQADPQEFLALYEEFHPHVHGIIRSIGPGELYKWGMRDREPMPQWTFGRVSMLGDAAHPITPFLGQGACTAVEDGMVLARCVAAASDVAQALASYEYARKSRANGVQLHSRAQAEAYQGATRDKVNLGRDAEALGLFTYNPATVPIELREPG